VLQTVEAMMEPNGSVRLLEKINVKKSTRVLVTLLPAANDKSETGDIEDLFGVLTAERSTSLDDMDAIQRC
jgi:hypothetical protein